MNLIRYKETKLCPGLQASAALNEAITTGPVTAGHGISYRSVYSDQLNDRKVQHTFLAAVVVESLIEMETWDILLDFSLTVKAAPHECVIRTSQPLA